MSVASTDLYGFRAEREGDTIRIADNMGGGTEMVAETHAEAVEGICRYVEGLAREFAHEMANELDYDEGDDSDENDG